MRWFLTIFALFLSTPATGGVIPLPEADVGTVIARGLDGVAAKGADRAVLFHGILAEVDPSGLTRTTEHRIERVLTVKGARELGVLWLGYDPSSNEIVPVRVRVFRKDGDTLEIDVGDALDVPAPLHYIYWPFRAHVLQLPRLLPGDTVEWILKRKGFSIAYLDDEGPGDEFFVPPQRGHFHDTILFAEDTPLVEKVYDLRLPAGMDLTFGTYGGPVEVRRTFQEEGGTRYVFRRRRVAALATESRAPQHRDTAAKVVLSTLPGWREKSVWFHQINEPMFAHDAALRDAAAEIVEGAHTDEERILRLLRWTAREIRYSGLQVIRGEGYTLHPGLLTWEHRAGVCKDIAGMLVTLMRAAGFKKTWPAMTMAGAQVADVPADQFNHCVVAWERTDGDMVMLDPTWAPWSRHPWSLAESEQQYLVGAPLGDVLRTTPTLAPSDNRVDITVDSRLRADGTLESRVKVRTTGYLETAVRRGMAGGPAARRSDTFDEIARTISPAAQITETRHVPKNLEDLDTPLRVEVSMEVPDWAQSTSDGHLTFVPPAFRHPVRNRRLWENLLIKGAAKRTRGLFFICPKEISLRGEVRLPGRYRLAAPVEGATISTPLGDVSWQIRVDDGNRLVTEQLAVFRTRRVAVEELAEYDRMVSPLQELEQTPVILIPEEATR